MGIIPTKKRGDFLYADDVNIISEGVEDALEPKLPLHEYPVPSSRDSAVLAENVDTVSLDQWVPVSITGQVNDFIQVTKPDDDFPQYGVTLEPISIGVLGMVGTSGGPYKTKVSGAVSYGDELTPTDGEGYMEVSVGGPFTAVADKDDENYCWVVFAGGGVGSQQFMIIAINDMIADNTLYRTQYIEKDGTLGEEVNVYRPYSIEISSGDIGFLSQDISGNPIFSPANMREEGNMPLVIEVRDSDPTSPVTGQVWMVT